ncbi:hypothetical protein Tco_0979389 [Tanacetum coccineum]
MANLLSRLKELETAAKSTMMADEVLMAEYIEELERYPRIRANVKVVETARALKVIHRYGECNSPPNYDGSIPSWCT